MRKNLNSFALALLLATAPAQAAPRWLTAVPRAVGRSYGNMFTFKRPWIAIQQWATIGSHVFDEKTTMDVFARCPACIEGNPIHINSGKQYGMKTALFDIFVNGTEFVTLEQYAAELDQGPNKYWRFAGQAAVSPAPIIMGIHGGIHNMNLPSTSPLTITTK